MPSEAPSYGIHLFLSIVFLILLLRVFPVAPPNFDLAIFSCVSMPAMYALSYYHAKLRRFRFVKPRSIEAELRSWSYEAVAFATSYVMGFLVFTALYGGTDLVTYTLAFIVVQGMRLFVNRFAESLRRLGVDVMRPLVMCGVAATTALLAFSVLALCSYFL